MHVCRSLVVLALLQAVVGCSLVELPLVPFQSDPPWRASIVSKTDCRIDGRYLGKGKLWQYFLFGSPYDKDKIWSVEKIKDRPIDELTPDDLKKIGVVDKKAISDAQWRYREMQDKKFDETAITEAEKTADGWKISLFGGDGTLYYINTISNKSSDVGCDASGRLVFRRTTRSSGAEFTPVIAYSYERIFEKKADGTLEVRYFESEWDRSVRLGKPDKETESSDDFPSAQ